MMLLVSGATKTLLRYEDPRKLGLLVVPGAGNSPKWLLSTTMCWAADNGAYNGFDAESYLSMQNRWATCPRNLFWTLPDVVGDAKQTLELWYQWWDKILLPNKALVAQDGIEDIEIPWDGDHKLDCLFIGGSTEFKMSLSVCDLIAEALSRNKWVHVGRVNSMQRLSHFHDMGVDSVDGSSMSMFPDTYIPRFLAFISSQDKQGKLHDLYPV